MAFDITQLQTMTPEDKQSLLQVLQQQSTPATQPADQTPAAPQGPAVAPPAQPQQPDLSHIQMQPGDKTHPADAIMQIGQKMFGPQPQDPSAPSGSVTTNYAPTLGRNKDGKLVEVTKAQGLIPRLLGMTDKTPIDPNNYWDTLVGTIGETAAKAILPGNTPVTPEGKPYLSASALKNIDQFVKVPRSKEDTPNPAIGKLIISKLTATYGADSPITQNAADYIKQNGGVSLNKMSDFLGSTMKEETPNFVRGANGLYQMYDRANKTFKTVPGQTTGVLETLGDPATKAVFDTKLNDFNSDPVVKNLKQKLDDLSSASTLLESNNPASIGLFFSNMAKGVGRETGMLTEGDIQRSVGDPGLASQLSRWIAKKGISVEDLGRGKFSDTDLKDFRGLLQDAGTSADNRYQQALARHVSSTVSVIPGLTKDFVTSAFDTANRFIPAKQRRLPGEATGQPAPAKKSLGDIFGN